MKLVFTGIQGCGKGTQARLLIENYGFTLIEMGWELRAIAKEESELGKEVKDVMEAGKQVSPEIVGKIIHATLEKYSDIKNIILDGFVRNEGNKKSLEEVCNDYTVLFFGLSKEKALDRLLGRMYNPKTGETFPHSIKVDPKTGDELIKRADDNEESILTRINAFVEKTLPVVAIQKKEGKVVEVNADQSIDEVHKEIVEKLGLAKDTKATTNTPHKTSCIFTKIKNFFSTK